MTTRTELLRAGRSKWRLGLTPQDQEANLFLFDRNKMKMIDIVNICDDSAIEEEVMDRIVMTSLWAKRRTAGA